MQIRVERQKKQREKGEKEKTHTSTFYKASQTFNNVTAAALRPGTGARSSQSTPMMRAWCVMLREVPMTEQAASDMHCVCRREREREVC